MVGPHQTAIYIKDDASVNKTKSSKSHSKHSHGHRKKRHQHNISRNPICYIYNVSINYLEICTEILI